MSEWKDFIPTCEKCGASNPTVTVVFREVSKQTATKARICGSCERLLYGWRRGKTVLELRGWLDEKMDRLEFRKE